MPVKSE